MVKSDLESVSAAFWALYMIKLQYKVKNISVLKYMVISSDSSFHYYCYFSSF